MPNRTSLVSQIIKDEASISVGVSSNQFTEMTHRSSDVLLKRLDLDLGCSEANNPSTTGVTQSRVRFCLISKPISEGNPVVGDMDNGKYVVFQAMCAASVASDGTNLTAIFDDWVHLKEILQIVVGINNNLFAVVEALDQTVHFVYLLRLFWMFI